MKDVDDEQEEEGDHQNAVRLKTYPPLKPTQEREKNIVLPKQMLQKILILLAQVQTDNTSKNLLNEMIQIVYSLHREKQVSKVYNNLHKAVQHEYSIHELREQ